MCNPSTISEVFEGGFEGSPSSIFFFRFLEEGFETFLGAIERTFVFFVPSECIVPFLFLDLMVSVFKLIGRGLPCSFKNRPHALQSTAPFSSLRQRGVVEVRQFLQTGGLLVCCVFSDGVAFLNKICVPGCLSSWFESEPLAVFRGINLRGLFVCELLSEDGICIFWSYTNVFGPAGSVFPGNPILCFRFGIVERML